MGRFVDRRAVEDGQRKPSTTFDRYSSIVLLKRSTIPSGWACGPGFSYPQYLTNSLVQFQSQISILVWETITACGWVFEVVDKLVNGKHSAVYSNSAPTLYWFIDPLHTSFVRLLAAHFMYCRYQASTSFFAQRFVHVQVWAKCSYTFFNTSSTLWRNQLHGTQISYNFSRIASVIQFQPCESPIEPIVLSGRVRSELAAPSKLDERVTLQVRLA